MRTLLFAVLFAATGFWPTAPSLRAADRGPALVAATGNDGGKKRKDEEKEEDFALSLRWLGAAIS